MALYLGIDATNWVCNLWYAQAGHDVLQTVAMRIAALERHLKPKLTVACFDHRSFRHGIYPQYKASRGEKPEGLIDDLRAAPEALANVAVVVRAEGFEADDCLATLAHQAVQHGSKAVLASPDKDLNQCLVQDRVEIIRKFSVVGHGLANVEMMTAQQLRIGTGIIPQQWIDYQTLAGDTGDGVPGCKGWGEKTAIGALRQCGNILTMFDHIGELNVSTSRKRALVEFLNGGQFELMRKLVTLRTDVDAVSRLFVARRLIRRRLSCPNAVE